jgi:multicomponent Na+:H+ antiporter subunit F
LADWVQQFLVLAAVLVLATVAGGLLGILRGREDADKMMATQLLSTGGIAVLLLAGVRADAGSVLDVALVLALLAAFAAIAFVKKGATSEMPEPPAPASGDAAAGPGAATGRHARDGRR